MRVHAKVAGLVIPLCFSVGMSYAGGFTYQVEIPFGLPVDQGFYGQLDSDPAVEAISFDGEHDQLLIYDLGAGVIEYVLPIPYVGHVPDLMGVRDLDRDGIGEYFVREGDFDTIYSIEGTRIRFALPGVPPTDDAIHQLDSDSNLEIVLRHPTDPLLMRFVDIETGAIDAQYTMPGNWTPHLIDDLDGDQLTELLIHCDCGSPGDEFVLIDTEGSASGIGNYSGTDLHSELSVSVRPVPSSASTVVELGVSPGTEVSASIFDAAGRMVRRLLEKRPLLESQEVLQWDATNDAGHRVPTGIYFIQVRSGGHLRSARITLVR